MPGDTCGSRETLLRRSVLGLRPGSPELALKKLQLSCREKAEGVTQECILSNICN